MGPRPASVHARVASLIAIRMPTSSRMGIMGVVGEAVLLLFRIVQDQAEFHPLARKFAIGEGAHPGQDRRRGRLRPRLEQSPCGPRHRPPVGAISSRSVTRGRWPPQVVGAPVTMAASAVSRIVIRVGPIAGSRFGAVEVLAPEQELDRVVITPSNSCSGARI